MQDDPEIIRSRLSGPFERDGVILEVQIFRLEDCSEWCLEIVDGDGFSTVWDDLFDSERDAHDEFLRALDEDGITSFLRDPSERIH